MTFAELQQEVQDNVIDAPPVVVNAIPRAINRALRVAQTRYNFWIMENVWTPIVAAGGQLVAPPGDWKSARGRPGVQDVSINPAGRVQPMSYAPLMQAQRQYAGGETLGLPRVIGLGAPAGNVSATPSMLLFPLPAAEVQLYIPYWRYLEPLTNGTDTNWFTETSDEWVVAQATAAMFTKDWNENRGGFWDQKAALLWREMKSADAQARFSGLNEWAVYPDANNPRIGL